MLGAVEGMLHKLVVLRGIVVQAVLDKMEEADNRIQRSPQLVACVREKIALEPSHLENPLIHLLERPERGFQILRPLLDLKLQVLVLGLQLSK